MIYVELFLGVAMVKQLVRLLLCSSFFFGASVFSQAPQKSLAIPQKELGNPDFVVSWLKKNSADKKLAEEFFVQGLTESQTKRWGPAGKSFGASAALYPTPRAFIAYADAMTQMLGQARKREGKLEESRKTDMKFALDVLSSARAVDDLMPALSAGEKDQLARDIKCLSVFLETNKAPQNCRPIDIYQK